MSELSELIYEIIKMNPKDDIKVAKKDYYNNETVKNIIEKFKFNNKTKNKLYQFATFIVRFENDRILKKLSKLKDKKYDNIFFDNLKNVKIKNVKFFSALFLQHLLFNKISIDELSMYFEVLGKMPQNYFDFIWSHPRGKTRLYNAKFGELLYKNNLAIKVFAIGDLEYELNEAGIKFFNNI